MQRMIQTAVFLRLLFTNRILNFQVMSTFPPAMVTTPKLLDLDINRNRLAAQE